MNRSPHRIFPYGLECAHCERWFSLVDAIRHQEARHPNCRTCAMEVELSRALLREAEEALEAVS